jgi:ribose transport system ATP-binding protein
MQESKSFLELRSVSKTFPGVRALDGVDLTIHSGEVHGLVGENGAGKSTLIKILMGVYQRDSGEIYLDNEQIEINTPMESQKYGLQAVYQDVVIARELSIGENFFLGNLPKDQFGLVNWVAINLESRKFLESLYIDLDPRRRIKDLLPGEQTMVTIAKVVRSKARYIIFDEPTARLTIEETQTLFKMIKRLQKDRLGIIYISHHLEEIFKICDVVTVLRDGKLVATKSMNEINEDELISMMVGRSMESMYAIKHVPHGDIVMEVKELTFEPRFRDVSFVLHEGEVLGLFGLVGAGRTDVLHAIFGANRIDSGEIWINGKLEKISSPPRAMELGFGLVPEERKIQGLALPLSVRNNINITSYKKMSRMGVIIDKAEKKQAERLVKELNIRTPSIEQIISNLSGGNQQKVVIGKWLTRNAKILLLDEPTGGVDIGAKAEIYHLIESLIKNGKSVILCSSYLPEVIGLSDRILVMAEGRLTGEVMHSDANEELILRLASKVEHKVNKEHI